MMECQNNLKIAFINIHGQSGLTSVKEKQIEDFVRKNNVDVIHCQEINIDENSFSCCNFISSNYYILSNNALNKYGTASIIRNSLVTENVRMDTTGRAIFFNIENLSLGNVYLQSGTDGISRGARESFHC